jgi:hypothetical protein
MATKKLKITCPVCGLLVEIDRLYKDHQFPRLVEVTYLGRGFKYEEVRDPYSFDPDLIEEIKYLIKEKLEKALKA